MATQNKFKKCRECRWRFARTNKKECSEACRNKFESRKQINRAHSILTIKNSEILDMLER